MNRTIGLLFLLALATACTAQGPGATDDGDGSPPGQAGPPVLVLAQGDGGDDGMSVADALGHRATDDLVSVAGALFIAADGTALLCDAIAESFPPQCGGERLEVRGLDPAAVADIQEANGVRWAESVVLFGSVE